MRQHRAEPIARRPDPIGAHQRRIQARHVRLHHAPRHARREQVQRRAGVRRAVARLVRRQRRVRSQIGADEQRIEDARRRARVREPLVTPRRHPGQREGGAAEHPRQAGDLLDVGQRVAPHARRIA